MFYPVAMAAFYRKTLQYEESSDTAEVCDKDQFDMISFTVILLYEGQKYAFYDEKLFHLVNDGDTVNVSVYKGYDRHGVLKHTCLTISELE